MRFRVDHRIRYSYSAPVFLEPHLLRLRPRTDASQQAGKFSMTVEPRPGGRHDFLDAEGNLATMLWFDDRTSSLSVTTCFEAETLCPNPFGYLVTEQAFLRLPAAYGPADAAALAPFLTGVDGGGGLQKFGTSVMEAANFGTLEFLSALCTRIYEDFTVEIREDGLPLPAADTMRSRRGACRDLAVLFMAVCRAAGLAARFVSGYQEGDPGADRLHLHAWAEVYVPGGGWRGYDPTQGLAVTDRHIALAASREPAGALPVSGSFRGTGVSSEMEYRIAITALSG